MAASIDAVVLQRWLHDGAELALLDVREPGQFGEGHLFFATPLPYSQLELEIGRLVPRAGTRIVVHDGGDDRVATRALERLEAMGYGNAHCFEGGTRAWAAAGYPIYKGVNLPSKTFGELVEHAYDTPHVSVDELAAMLQRGDDVVVLDGRPWTEYTKMSIPSGVCCPNGELVYRVRQIVASPTTTIVVNCAGRTRSILGAQMLRSFGIPNPVYALQNGTQGWHLAGLELERGAARKYPAQVPDEDLRGLQQRARSMAEAQGVAFVTLDEVQRWLDDPDRCCFLCDVRTPEEYAAGTIAGAQHTPGGQFIQSTDQYVGVRNAQIVVFDNEGVRAPVCASWLAQMGHRVSVLADGASASLRVKPGPVPRLPALASLAPAELPGFLHQGGIVLDLRASAAYRLRHVDGAHWSIRPVVTPHARLGRPLALMAEDARIAQLAAVDLVEAGASEVRIVSGSIDDCRAAGVPLVATPGFPPDSERIDFLFFVHDRHEGNKEAARAYLAWETGLLEQLHPSERTSFRLPASH